jgi:phage terminase large subunit GpA-like protein
MHDIQKIKGLAKQLAELAKPPPNIPPWLWAEQNIYLPSSQAASAGLFRTDMSPWVREISKAIQNPKYRRVIAVQGAQTSKSIGVLMCSLLWKMSVEPVPALFFCNTEESVLRLARRFGDIIAASPSIYKKTSRHKDTRNAFYFNGVPLYFLTAGSKDNVASMPAGVVAYDEAGDVKTIKGQGNPFFLTEVRGSTFMDFCQIGCGTPALGKVTEYTHHQTGLIHWSEDDDNVESLVWKLWQDSTRHEYMLPCPECHTYFTPKAKLLKYPDHSTPDQAAAECYLQCPHCKANISPKFQYQMVTAGKLLSPGMQVVNDKIVGNGIDSKYYGAFVSGLCSLWRTWPERARELCAAHLDKIDPGHLQSTINTHFGECYYEMSGDQVSWEAVAEKRENFWRLGEVPTAVQVLTCFADVHGLHIDCVVMGWAHNDGHLEGYVIQYKVFGGSTYETAIWSELEKFLQQDFGGLEIRYIGIDAGYNPSKSEAARAMKMAGGKVSRNMVFDFVRNHSDILMTKGASHEQSKPWRRTLTDVNFRGAQVRTGLSMWLLDTDYFKTEVFVRLNREKNVPGAWHFPVDLPDEFFKQATNEFFDYTTNKWKEMGENHVLDCLCGNLFLAYKFGFKTRLPERVIIEPEEKETTLEPQDNWHTEGWGESVDDW